jgi:hypothetical protein
MLEFMHNGGFMMWPLLGLGVLAIVSAMRQRLVGEGMIDATRLARAVLVGSLGWCGMGLILVSRAALDEAPWKLYIVGFGEALSPAVLGLCCFAIVGVITSIAGARVSGPDPG